MAQAQVQTSLSPISLVTIQNYNANFKKRIHLNNLPPWEISKNDSHFSNTFGNNGICKCTIKISTGDWEI